jgi:hypothetical protein
MPSQSLLSERSDVDGVGETHGSGRCGADTHDRADRLTACQPPKEETVEPLSVTLNKAKETKNTIRYEEAEGGQPLVIGTLYLQKPAAERLENPESILVTIAPASPTAL